MERYVVRSTSLLLSTLLGATVFGCAGSDAPLPNTRGDDQPGDQIGSDAAVPGVEAVSNEATGASDAAVSNVDPALDVDPASKSGPKSGSLAPNYVPGELVIKFKSESTTAVIHDVASTLQKRRSFVEITADRSASLDTVFSRHGVKEALSLLGDRESLSTVSAKALVRSRVVAPFRLRAANLGAGKAVANAVSGAVTAPDLRPLEDLVNVYRLQLPAGASLDAAMSDLQNDPHVEYVHPNYLAHLDYAPNDPYFSSSGSWGQPRADQWDIKKTRVPLAWDAARGAGVVVAVVDTGLDFTHPDIAGNVWTNTGEVPGNGVDDDANGYVDDVNGWNTYFGSNESSISRATAVTWQARLRRKTTMVSAALASLQTPRSCPCKPSAHARLQTCLP